MDATARLLLRIQFNAHPIHVAAPPPPSLAAKTGLTCGVRRATGRRGAARRARAVPGGVHGALARVPARVGREAGARAGAASAPGAAQDPGAEAAEKRPYPCMVGRGLGLRRRAARPCPKGLPGPAGPRRARIPGQVTRGLPWTAERL